MESMFDNENDRYMSSGLIGTEKRRAALRRRLWLVEHREGIKAVLFLSFFILALLAVSYGDTISGVYPIAK